VTAIIALAGIVLMLTEAHAVEERVSLRTGTGTLAGTLLLPDTAAGAPVALLVAGSGPTDRDGNNPLLPGANNHLRLLAEGLATRGIASLRYDKRGIAESRTAAPREEDLRFENYVDDAVGWAEQLRRDPRFVTSTIVGHSEGSLIGMLAAQRIRPNGFVSLEGPGRSAPALIREQLRGGSGPELVAQSERILRELEAGRTTSSPPPELASLFRTSVQPYLISWFKYDPAKEIGKVDVPVLIVQGGTDQQVSIEDARYLRAAKRNAEFRVIPDMNHVLKSVSDDPSKQLAAYSDPTLPIHGKLVEAISSFISALAPRGTR
jgi:pimeloyl-ACP methyl ester carboxylesterase